MFRVKVGHLPDGLDLSGDIMKRAHVEGVQAVGLGLRGTDMRRSRIEACTFADCDLAGALAQGRPSPASPVCAATLEGADLRKVAFHDVEVVDCLVDGLELDGATRSGHLVLPGYEVPERG
ncbi:MAG: hypothetical protein R2711_09070 [Acidimicrobiales bacterium]